MRIRFFIYDGNNAALENNAEIQFKTYLHGVYKPQVISNRTAIDAKVYSEVFSFGMESQVYYQFRNVRTGQCGEAKTVNVHTYTQTGDESEEITLFVELKFETNYNSGYNATSSYGSYYGGGYSTYNGVSYSNNNSYYYNRDSYTYLSNFVTQHTDILTYSKLLAYMKTLNFSYYIDRQNLQKSVSAQLVKVLPQKTEAITGASAAASATEIFQLIELIDKDTREGDPYTICKILVKLIEKASNQQDMYAKASKLIKETSSLFRTTDWLRELHQPQVTLTPIERIFDLLDTRARLPRFDCDSHNVMDELIKIKKAPGNQSEYSFEVLRANIMRKCNDDQYSDLLRFRFLFKYLPHVVNGLGKEYVLRGFMDLLNKRRERWLQRDMVKELAMNAKNFIKFFDSQGDILFANVSKQAFVKDLSETEQVNVLEAYFENGLPIRYPWRRTLIESIRSHKTIEDVERITALVFQISPFLHQLPLMKKYFMDRVHYFYVSVFEKIRMKTSLLNILNLQLQTQQDSEMKPISMEIENANEMESGESPAYSGGASAYLDQSDPADDYLDLSFDEWDASDIYVDTYNKPSKNTQSRGNRTVATTNQKKEATFEMKRLTAAEIKEFEVFVNAELGEVIKKLNAIELLKDVKQFKEEDDTIYKELRDQLELNFGKNLIEEWNYYPNFKEKFEQLRKLSLEKSPQKYLIAQLILRKYTESAITFYKFQLRDKGSPQHFHTKNLLDFLHEAGSDSLETKPFTDVFRSDFNSFLQGHNQVSIQSLKTFLAAKEVPRLFEVMKADFLPFKRQCLESINVFDSKLEQIGSLFKNFKDFFAEDQHAFSKEFNLEQKSGNIINLVNQFNAIEMYMDFNYMLKDCEIYQSLKRFLLMNNKIYKNEAQAFHLLKYNLEFFVRAVTKQPELTVECLLKYDFLSLQPAPKLFLEADFDQLPESELILIQQQLLAQQQVFQPQQQQQQQQQAQQVEQVVVVPPPAQQEQAPVVVVAPVQAAQQMDVEVEVEVPVANPAAAVVAGGEVEVAAQQQVIENNVPQQQQQQVEGAQNANNNNNNNAPQLNRDQLFEALFNQELAQAQLQSLIAAAASAGGKGGVKFREFIYFTNGFVEFLSIVDLKNHAGSTYAKCVENVIDLLEILDVSYSRRELETAIFEIFAVDFFRKYMVDVTDILKQNSVDISEDIYVPVKSQLSKIEAIEKFAQKSIWEIASDDFRPILSCFTPVSSYHPKLIELLRRSEEVVTYSLENFSGSEGRGFLDLNDIIDDQDVDISSLIIKLNQLTPFINQLVKIKTKNMESKALDKTAEERVRDVTIVLVELFETVGKYLSDESEQINFEDSLNNFYKIKNMSLNFDKKKSYILISQQIAKQGIVSVYYETKLAQIGVDVKIEDTVYSEEEINAICSKVIIEQNTTNIVINQARRALAPKAGSSPEELQAEEETLLQESAAIKQKIEQFKDMWTRIGELKLMLLEIKSLGYFDIDSIKFVYSNEERSIEENFAKINADKHVMQDLLKNWKEAIKKSSKQYPLFSLLGHNLYASFFEFVTAAKSTSNLPHDLQDILNLPILAPSKKRSDKNLMLVEDDSIADPSLLTLTPIDKLNKIASWFEERQNLEGTVSQVAASNQMEVEGAVVAAAAAVVPAASSSITEAVLYSGTKELVDVVLRVFENDNDAGHPFEFYQYFYCDQLTQIQDFDLFIQRFEYFVQPIARTYVIILNTKLDAAFTYRAIETIESVNREQQHSKDVVQHKNNLLVLARREHYSELLSNLTQTSVEDFLSKNTQNKLSPAESAATGSTAAASAATTTVAKAKSAAENYKAEFYISQQPGAGKSYRIQKIFAKNSQSKNNIRVAINGLGNKEDLISLFRERLEQCDKSQPVYVHLDVYPIEQYDLNMLLFEVIAFKSLSIHQKKFIEIGADVSFFIEINNTLKNDLQESLFIKDHFKCINVKFNIEDYNPEVSIVGQSAYNYAAIVYNYLQLSLLAETDKDVFDRVENQKQQAGEEEGEEEGEEGEEEEGEGQEGAAEGGENDDEDDDEDEENENENEENADAHEADEGGEEDSEGGDSRSSSRSNQQANSANLSRNRSRSASLGVPELPAVQVENAGDVVQQQQQVPQIVPQAELPVEVQVEVEAEPEMRLVEEQSQSQQQPSSSPVVERRRSRSRSPQLQQQQQQQQEQREQKRQLEEALRRGSLEEMDPELAFALQLSAQSAEEEAVLRESAMQEEEQQAKRLLEERMRAREEEEQLEQKRIQIENERDQPSEQSSAVVPPVPVVVVVVPAQVPEVEVEVQQQQVNAEIIVEVPIAANNPVIIEPIQVVQQQPAAVEVVAQAVEVEVAVPLVQAMEVEQPVQEEQQLTQEEIAARDRAEREAADEAEARRIAEEDEAFARRLQMEEGGGNWEGGEGGDMMDFEFMAMLSKPTYRIEQLEFFQELLKKFFVDKLAAQNIEPCFHQLTNFINLFGSEMMKFEKCYFLEKNILHELEPQLLQQGLRSRIVELSLHLSFFVSTNQLRQTNTVIDPQNRNRREYILHEKAEKIQRFSELMTSFVTFQEQENPCLTSFFPSSSVVPQVIQNLYTIQGQQNDLVYFDQNLSQNQLLKWLNMLINKFGDYMSHQVTEKVKRLAIQRDNFFKIAMIFMRIRALSPIILMGEAGTGKTALIELLSALMDAKFSTLNIHAGITEKEVVDFIYKSIASADSSLQKVIIFFDEMNTNKLVEGIFKEIIVDRCLKGKKLPDTFIPITAINPYKLKSKEQKQMFNLQVHGGIKREIMSRMNNTDLEYMVEPLPESLYSFIWNIDHLTEDEEDQYIMKIVHFKNEERQAKRKRHFDSEQLRKIIEMLSYSQKFLRKIMGCQSACSLRDVARFTKLLFWFNDFLVKCIAQGLKLHQVQECAINLALYVGYCVRIPLYQQRKQYTQNILKTEDSKEDVEAAQSFLADQIEVPKGIVKNTAFKQNTLTLFASIMNKIPVILIGQPGCTKTLSLRLLIQSLRGDQSKSQLFKELKTLVPIYYQGHVQSTSERIMEVFSNANKKQAKIELDNQQKRYLSMVYLEEIGLAEISPHNPLKVLHQALEKPKVAVACISNWPLDQSKMNRMLSVYRLDTSKKELMETVVCIFEELISFEKDEALCKALSQVGLSKEFAKLAVRIYRSYNTFLKHYLPEHEQFHGLRDFYGMSKLFCYKYLDYILNQIHEHIGKITLDQLDSLNMSELIQIDETIVKGFLMQSYLRHFSGMPDALKYLLLSISQVLNEEEPNQQSQQQQQSQNAMERQESSKKDDEMEMEVEDENGMMILKKASSTMPILKELLLTSKQSKSTFLKSDQIDEVQLIEENLTEKSKYFLSRNLMVITHNTQKALEYILSKIQSENQPVKVFLGSDFPEDKKSETSYQIINEIISCVESGVFVVLQNLENVYQSLYELLNQNYHFYNGKYFCRVSLGADTSNVEVSSKFKLILIANHIQIPCLSGPLLNRFEKHIFEQSMILTEEDQQQIASLENLFVESSSSTATDSNNQSASSQSHQQNKNKVSQIFSFTNVSQIVESVFLQQKHIIQQQQQAAFIEAGGDPQSAQQMQQQSIVIEHHHRQVILQKLYHQASFKRVLFFSNDQEQLNSYIASQYHFGLNDFISNRILKRMHDVEDTVRSFCLFSSSTYTTQQQSIESGSTRVSSDVIHLAEVTSQMHLAEKLREFFDAKEVICGGENVVIPILFVVCDMEEDSIERIIFTKQKIAEALAATTTTTNGSLSVSAKRVIMTVRVSEKFLMIPASIGWEHYYIDELIPLQNVHCSEMREQMNLQFMLNNQSEDFLRFFRVDPLLASFLRSSENISIAYRKVRYLSDVSNYKTSRLTQLKLILLNPNNSLNLQRLNHLAIQIISIRFAYTLHALGIKSVGDFILKQVFKKGFIYQASSILKAIVSGFEDLMQQSLCFFIELLEKQQIIYCLTKKHDEDMLFNILVKRILSSLDVSADPESLNLTNFNEMRMLSSIENDPNAKFTQRTVQLLTVSADLLSPIEQSKVLSSLIEQQIAMESLQTEKSNLLAITDRVMGQVRDLFSSSELQELLAYASYYTRDYLLLRSDAVFGDFHFAVLQEILAVSQAHSNEKLDEMRMLLMTLLAFETHSKAILKAHSMVEFYAAELKFELNFANEFQKFCVEYRAEFEPNLYLNGNEMTFFNIFIVNAIFMFLHDNISLVSRKRQLSRYYTKLLRYIDSLDLLQFRLASLDRIVQTSKLIIQFSEEIFDNNSNNSSSNNNNNNGTSNFDILKTIDFEEIRGLNFAYIQQLRESVKISLLFADESDFAADSLMHLLYHPQKDLQLTDHQNAILGKREKRLVQFEKSWCKCIINVILSNVNSISDSSATTTTTTTTATLLNSRLLKFIVDLEISMTSQKSENLQSIFKVIVLESFARTTLEQLLAFYEAERNSSTLEEESAANAYHTEHFSLIVLSELFQEHIIRPSMSNASAKPFLQILLTASFEHLTILQKIVYFSIFREVTHQILLDNFTALDAIFSNPLESSQNLMRISTFFANLKEKSFQLYVLKQLYMTCKSDMHKTISDSSFFSNAWISDFTRQYKRLIDTDFLTPLEKSTYKRHFLVYRPIEASIKDLLWSEITFMRNVFRDIYDGKLAKQYYPFMMFNNIQILFDRDPKNNMQLYQCQNCLEYIFSDQCPDLQSKHRCLQCGQQIALNNQNTKRVLQSACQNIAELHKIINEDQWKGYYMMLEDDKPDFKLNEGTSFDFRVMSIVYNTIILLSKTRNYRYFFETKESLLDWNNSLQEVVVKEINKYLKIHYEANAEEHLISQIQVAVRHVKEYLTKIHKFKEDDVPIILFKFLQLIHSDIEIKACETTQERSAMNTRISDNIRNIFENLSRLSQVEHSFSQRILEQQESLALAPNFKRNLRYFDAAYTLDTAYMQLNEQIPNNEFQVLKKLLAFKEVNQISRILKVFTRFYKYMNREFSNKYSLKKAQDISFSKALKNNTADPLYQYYVQEFLPAWNELREREKVFTIECESPEIPEFDIHTKLNYLVFGDQKNISSFTNGLDLMCQLQNKYIHHIYQLSVIDANENKLDSKLSQQVKALFENSDEDKKLKQIPLDQANPSIHVVKAYDESIVKQYVFSNLEYGQGKKYIFDLEQLQQRLVREVLTGSVLIDIEKTVRFKYLNEVHQIGLLSNNLIPQETIFFEIRSKIQKFFPSKEQAFEFLQQLSTIFQMFKAEQLQGELSIKSALDTLQLKLKQENMKEILSEQLKLKHLNDLICCIEEIQLDNLVELCNPFYKLPIENETAQLAADFIKINSNIDDFLIALGRFTVRCLSSDASSISPQSNLFEQVFYSDIYSELWRDPSKLDRIYKEACEVKVMIGQAYSLFQFIQKQKNNIDINAREVVSSLNEPKANIFL